MDKPTQAELRQLLYKHRLTQAQAAELIGIEYCTIQRYFICWDSKYSALMPAPYWRLLKLELGEEQPLNYDKSLLKEAYKQGRIAELQKTFGKLYKDDMTIVSAHADRWLTECLAKNCIGDLPIKEKHDH